MKPTPLAYMMETQERAGSCTDCAGAIDQSGTKLGDQWIWSPLRCRDCAEKRDVELAGVFAERQTDLERTRERRSQKRQEVALIELGVPPLYADVTLENFQLHGSPEDRDTQLAVVRLARRYMGSWPDVAGELLILRGGPGTGKGHWAYSVAKGVASHGASVRVVKLADLVRRLRASWGKEEQETESAVLTFFRGLDLLVIDEVSRHAFYGQSIHQHLYDVIDHRIEYRRPTILTTNEEDDGLEAILRPALLDRVKLHGGVLEFGNASYRARPRLEAGA
jgi:DNA replication protein DnaC